MAPRQCPECGLALGRRNTSGYCRRHLAVANARNPEWRERQRAGARRAMDANPERREEYAARARALKDLPHVKEQRRERWMRERVWETGNASQPRGSAARIRAGAHSRATRLADIPAHLRDEYVALTRTTGLRAAERKRVILAQDDAEMRRWRRQVGAPEPQDAEG